MNCAVFCRNLLGASNYYYCYCQCHQHYYHHHHHHCHHISTFVFIIIINIILLLLLFWCSNGCVEVLLICTCTDFHLHENRMCHYDGLSVVCMYSSKESVLYSLASSVHSLHCSAYLPHFRKPTSARVRETFVNIFSFHFGDKRLGPQHICLLPAVDVKSI